MLPGEVYYYAANSSVICIGRRPKRQLQAMIQLSFSDSVLVQFKSLLVSGLAQVTFAK